MPTLLLADDSVATQRVITLTFADQAFRVVTVGDGQQAIDRMTGMRPDVVLASTSLPRNNGYELSQYMLGVETLKDVPVLLLSGAFESVDGTRLKASGARGVLEKPLEPTAVINRVRELLGLKGTPAVQPAGRLITPATTTADKPAPVADPPAVGLTETAADEPLAVPAVAPDTRPAAAAAAAPGHGDYRDALATAFDSLDRHLAGRPPETPPAQRGLAPTPDQTSAVMSDTPAPGPPPAPAAAAGTNAVFEVDSDWFAEDSKQADHASRHDILAGVHEAMPPAAAAPADPIFEVDDDWFAEDEKVRQSRAADQRELAAEMGIHDLDLPRAEPVPNTPAPAEGLDFDFGLDHTAAAPVAPEASELPVPQNSMADDFAALLAIETGDAPAMAPPVTVAALAVAPAVAPAVVPPAAAPELTEAMLDQIAQRVADRLSSGTFGAELREAMTATLRDTVRSVVSETAERLVRDEIARVKARADRDIH